MTCVLHDILAPDSIAIVGASADPTKRGYKAVAGLLNDGYEGAIYPINRKVSEILGLKTYPTLASLPTTADMALICTPAKSIPDLLAECCRNGVKGATILASGFGEVNGAGEQLERELL